MDDSVTRAWGALIDRMSGGGDADAAIMAAQLERAATLLDRPAIDPGSLFTLEPSSYPAALDRLAGSDAGGEAGR
ncbi:hypothetical protein [Mongoliimonas terrestris]|uniref:hypothetical protein n=1 Tax=Mongoliimonas terrestris TaxID=1709001 RepID=UPI0009497024|nr:hypothetical protein [Mongoliimonas terrestris]